MANNKDFGKVEWVEEKVSGKKNWKHRKIKNVIDKLDKGDRIIISELSRLGRSMLEIMGMLSILNQKGACVYSIIGFAAGGKIVLCLDGVSGCAYH